MKTTKHWKIKDISKSKYLGVLEFKDKRDEWQSFEVLKTAEYVVFGSSANVGFFQSGFIKRELGEPLEETLAELLSELETYYNDGPEYTCRIVCNERM